METGYRHIRQVVRFGVTGFATAVFFLALVFGALLCPDIAAAIEGNAAPTAKGDGAGFTATRNDAMLDAADADDLAPITGIQLTCGTIELYEGVDCEMATDELGRNEQTGEPILSQPYQRYIYDAEMGFRDSDTLLVSRGDTEKRYMYYLASGWISYSYEGFDFDQEFEVQDDQSAEHPWGIGEHEVTLYCVENPEVCCTMHVVVKANPVVGVVFKPANPVKLVEGVDQETVAGIDESGREVKWNRFANPTWDGLSYQIGDRLTVTYADSREVEYTFRFGDYLTWSIYGREHDVGYCFFDEESNILPEQGLMHCAIRARRRSFSQPLLSKSAPFQW